MENVKDLFEKKESSVSTTNCFHQLKLGDLYGSGGRFVQSLDYDLGLDERFILDEEWDEEYEFNMGVDEEEVFDENGKIRGKNYAKKPTVYDLPPSSVIELELVMDKLTQDGGVLKQVLIEGSGVIPPPCSKIFYEYSGFMENEVVPFDSSFGKRNEELILNNELSSIIHGLHIGLRSMSVLELSRFIIRPQYAFGPLGCLPRVKPDATVIFTVKITGFISEKQMNSFRYMSLEQISALPFQKVMDEISIIRTSGNKKYMSKNYAAAIREYRLGISILESYSCVKIEENEKIRENCLSTLLSNLAQCYIRLNKGAQACAACKFALRFKSDEKMQAKILYKFAHAKLLCDAFDDAYRLANAALKEGISKNNIMRLKREIDDKKEKFYEKEKKVASLMMGLTVGEKTSKK